MIRIVRTTSAIILLLPLLACAQGTITTVVGTGSPGFSGDGSPATSAAVKFPSRVALDGRGNIYIADQGNHRIRKFALLGTMTTVAGTGSPGFSGDGGSALNASLNSPYGVAVDAGGSLYIVDTGNVRVRKVTPDGTINTVAGNGTAGFSGDGGPAVLASVNDPRGVALDVGGNIYIADAGNHRIRKVSPDGTIRTVAGNGTALWQGDGGPATLGTLNTPSDVVVVGLTMYIADTGNSAIRKVASTGTITTVAGKGISGFSGDGGPATNATLNTPWGIAVDSLGNIFIADTNNQRVRKVSTNGNITTVAGTGDQDFFGDRTKALAAALNQPHGVAVDGFGLLHIADWENHRIRVVSPDGFINTVAGTGTGGYRGDATPATEVFLNSPAGVGIDAVGDLLIADAFNNRIRKVSSDGSIITVAGGSGAGSIGVGDGGLATNAFLSAPFGVAADSAGSLYIADSNNGRIRKVELTGLIRTVAGDGGFGFNGDDVPAITSSLSNPLRVTFDRSGNFYIADSASQRIRKVDRNGVITTVAGNGTVGFAGDGGPATKASLRFPTDVAVDSAGKLYIADTDNQRIRVVATNGTISTLAGTGTAGLSGDGGPATSATLNGPVAIAADAFGNVYFSESQNHIIRKVSANGIISTVAGNGQSGFSGDGGPATSASLFAPYGLALDGKGALYVADRFNNRIRKVQLQAQLSTLPSVLTFTAAAGGDNPPAQSLAISSSSGTLSWTAEAATQNGGFWLFASTASGSTPGTLTATVKVAGLAPGTYQGTLTIQSASAGNSPLIVNVMLTVTPAPTIALSSSSLSFSGQQGSANPASQTVTVSNSGAGVFNWTATTTQSGGAWLSVTPPSGTGTATLTVSVNIPGLTGGTYQGAIQVASTGATNTPQTINVTLVLAAAPVAVITLDPSALQIGVNVGANPPPLTFRVLNTGTGTLAWSAAASQSGGNWLSFSPSSGLAPSTLTVTVNSAALAAGNYTGTILITVGAGTNASNSPQTLTVTLVVGGPVIGDNGVVNGASFSKDAIASPGAVSSLFGTNLATRTEAAVSLPLPVTLAGAQVLVNNNPAPLFFVSGQQINFQMPADITGGTVPVAVVTDGIRGLSAQVKLAGQAPGIFSASPGGTGQGAVLNQDFSPNSAQNAASVGSVVQIFLTGLGVTDPPIATGQPGATQEPFNRTVVTPVVLIGGVQASVLFSAAAPGFVGLYQVNARIPASIPSGNATSLQTQVGSLSSNTVTIAVK